jgi:hypothetical protein
VSGLRVSGIGFGFRVGFTVGFRVEGLGFDFWNLGFRCRC